MHTRRSVNFAFFARAFFALTALLAAEGGLAAKPVTSLRIEEASFVPIGGIDQWITIRGDNREKPILLVVHGGPGDPQSALVSTYEPYEHEFVVVQWDQRGAGKTFARNRDTVKELSLDRMAADGVELAEYLRSHLHQKKLVVLAHSWGTILATEMVKRKPEFFLAYVGTGQYANWCDGVREQWKYLHAAAHVAQDQTTLDLMQRIGEPDPFNVGQYFSWRLVLNRKYLGSADAAWIHGLRALLDSSPGMTPDDAKAIAEGTNFSAMGLLKVMMTADPAHNATECPVPFFVIQGQDDIYAPTNLAVDYFNSVHAPKKRLTVIKGAGHFALVTHREEFIAALVRDVKSVAP